MTESTTQTKPQDQKQAQVQDNKAAGSCSTDKSADKGSCGTSEAKDSGSCSTTTKQ